jgi:hypothetical protein
MSDLYAFERENVVYLTFRMSDMSDFQVENVSGVCYTSSIKKIKKGS